MRTLLAALVLGLLLPDAASAGGLLDITHGVVGRGGGDPLEVEPIVDLVVEQSWREAAEFSAQVADLPGVALDARLWEAATWMRAGEADRAHAALLEAMDRAPGDPRVLLLASWVLFETGSPTYAARLARRVPSDAPDAVGALVLQMRALSAAGRERRAARLRRLAAGEGRTDAWFWYEAALEDATAGRAEAGLHFARALRSPGASAEHYRTFARYLAAHGDLRGAARVGAQGVARFPRDHGLAVLAAGHLLAGGDGAAAVALLQDWAARNPGNGGGFAVLGLAQAETGAHEAAAASIQRALELGEDDATLYSVLGRALVATGQGEAAWQALQRGLALHPADEALLSARLEVARSGADAGRVLEATEDRFRAGLADEQDAQLAYRAASSTGRYQGALTWAERGAGLGLPEALALEMRGTALAELGRAGEALSAYEASLALESSNALLLNNFAWFLLSPGGGMAADPARALSLAEAAVAGAPRPVAAYLDTLAAACWATGDPARAVRLQQQAVALSPESAELSATLLRYQDGLPGATQPAGSADDPRLNAP